MQSEAVKLLTTQPLPLCCPMPAAERGCRGVFATHLHDLVPLTQPLEQQGRLRYCKMEVVGEGVATWRVVEGDSTDSMAFATALQVGGGGLAFATALRWVGGGGGAGGGMAFVAGSGGRGAGGGHGFVGLQVCRPGCTLFGVRCTLFGVERQASMVMWKPFMWQPCIHGHVAAMPP